jgi:hypothetical protein
MGKTLATMLVGLLIGTGIASSGCELTPEGRSFFGGLLYHGLERGVEHEVDNFYSHAEKQLKETGITAFTCNSWVDQNGDGYFDISECVNIKNTFSKNEDLSLVFYFENVRKANIGKNPYLKLFNSSGEESPKLPLINNQTRGGAVFNPTFPGHEAIFKPDKYRVEFYDESGKKRLVHYFTIEDN